jgi:hypothetical protein
VRPTAERLADALARLPIRVDGIGVEHTRVAVASYPGGPRPTSTAQLAGGGKTGRGEHVGWTEGAHARFARVLPGVPRGAHRLDAWCAAAGAATADPYDRAALEAAAVDLALRQCDETIFALADHAPRPVRYVVSTGRLADPVAATADEPAAEWKLDVDAAWGDDVLGTLAACRHVAIVDWKTAGEPADHARIASLLPAALVEDPGPADGRWPALACAARVSADGWLAAPGDLAALSTRPGAVNLKMGRMGGIFATLALAAAAEAAGIPVYVGGMFEVGPGRRQAQALAALLSPDGPNDVAPLATNAAPAARPERIVPRADRPGFGDDG